MIVTDLGDRWRLITQPDHAHFSGALLRLWRGPELSAHPRRDDIVFAGQEHDNGWRETDAAPRWNAAEEAPHDFLSVPDDVRIEVFLRGTARFAGERPYAALLMTLHALGFSSRRDGDEEWNDFIDRLEERRDELVETSGVALAEARRDYCWVQWGDATSLAACAGWTDGFEREVPEEGSGEMGTIAGRFDPRSREMQLDPLPLAGSTRFHVPCREIEKRPYAGDADFATALATARWEHFEVRVVGGGGG